MSTVARGISSHELVEMIEATYMRLALLDITGPLADRLATTMVLGACGLTGEQAREAAERLFPRKEVRDGATLDTHA